MKPPVHLANGNGLRRGLFQFTPTFFTHSFHRPYRTTPAYLISVWSWYRTMSNPVHRKDARTVHLITRRKSRRDGLNQTILLQRSRLTPGYSRRYSTILNQRRVTHSMDSSSSPFCGGRNLTFRLTAHTPALVKGKTSKNHAKLTLVLR